MNASAHTKPNDLAIGRYRHYKGGEYEVIGVAHHTETDECVVVYRYLYGDFGLSVRPFAMFVGTVNIEGKAVPRFQFIGEDKIQSEADY